MNKITKCEFVMKSFLEISFFLFSFFLSLCPFGISAKEISGWESVRVNYDKRMTVHLDGENCWWDFRRSATKLG